MTPTNESRFPILLARVNGTALRLAPRVEERLLNLARWGGYAKSRIRTQADYVLALDCARRGEPLWAADKTPEEKLLMVITGQDLTQEDPR